MMDWLADLLTGGKISWLNTQCAALHEAGEILERERDALMDRVGFSANHINRLMAERDAAQKRLQGVQAGLNASEQAVARIQRQLFRTRDDLDVMRGRHRSLQSETAIVHNLYGKLERRNSNLAAQVESLTQRRDPETGRFLPKRKPQRRADQNAGRRKK